MSARLLIGSLVDPGGVARAKAVPLDRGEAFEGVGMGASPSWNVFCADDRLAFTERFSVVGDVRLRTDRNAVRDLGDGLAWAPVTVYEQDGTVSPSCTRSALLGAVTRLSTAGITALVGHELEFQLFDPARPDDPRPLVGQSPRWSAYGLGAVIDEAAFAQALLARASTAGLTVLQVHAEAAPRQFEVSLAPTSPVEAADDLVLARTVVRLAARDAGLAASFSPLPVVDGGSNGAHQHLSFHGADGPLLSGGEQLHGLTDAGAAAIAGILASLPDLGAVLSGSPLSGARLKPGMWAGARACWGLENREAAVRLIAAGSGSPHGAHIEIKPIDPSANPYLATALLLEAALWGIEHGTPLARPVDVDPATVDGALLPTSTAEQLARLEASSLARRALGAELIEAIVAVRGLELESWGDRPIEERVERFRFTWG